MPICQMKISSSLKQLFSCLARQLMVAESGSYSGVIGILFPEQLRAVSKRLCRCHIISSVSVLKVSMRTPGICPGVHACFTVCFTFFDCKEIGPLCGDLLPKRKYFFFVVIVLAAAVSTGLAHYRRLPAWNMKYKLMYQA